MSEYEGHLKYGDLRISIRHEGECNMWFLMFLVIMSELPDKFKCICFCVCCLVQGYSNYLDYNRKISLDSIIETSTKTQNEILNQITERTNQCLPKN